MGKAGNSDGAENGVKHELTRKGANPPTIKVPTIKLPTVKLAEQLTENLAGLSGFTKAVGSIHSSALNAMKPVLDAQAAAARISQPLRGPTNWANEFGVINSDALKIAGLGQSNLIAVTAQLTKSVDFGLGASVAKAAGQFATVQSAWLADLASRATTLQRSFFPPNLRDIPELTFEEVEQVVMVDGIALYAVPRAEIAQDLIRADGAEPRREILERRWKDISADCRAATDECDSQTVGPYVAMINAALNALDGGHIEASQALTASALDAAIRGYWGSDRSKYMPDATGQRTNAAYDDFGAHEYIAFAPIWQAFQKFFPDKGLPIPHTFSRHATAHTVSTAQYTLRNAVQAVMVATGMLVYLDARATALGSRSTA